MLHATLFIVTKPSLSRMSLISNAMFELVYGILRLFMKYLWLKCGGVCMC